MLKISLTHKNVLYGVKISLIIHVSFLYITDRSNQSQFHLIYESGTDLNNFCLDLIAHLDEVFNYKNKPNNHQKETFLGSFGLVPFVDFKRNFRIFRSSTRITKNFISTENHWTYLFKKSFTTVWYFSGSIEYAFACSAPFDYVFLFWPFRCIIYFVQHFIRNKGVRIPMNK